MPKTKTQTEPDEAPPAPMQMVEIEYSGQTFVIPKDRDDWDAEAFLAMGNGDHIAALQMILGRDQWVKLRQIGTSRRVVKEFSAVFGEVADKECVN